MTDLSLLHHAKSKYGQEFFLLAAFFFANDIGFIWLNHIPEYFYYFHTIQLMVIAFFVAMISRPDRGAFKIPGEAVTAKRMLAYTIGAFLAGIACHYVIEYPLAELDGFKGRFSVQKITDPDSAFYDLTFLLALTATIEEVVFRRMAVQWLETLTQNAWLLVSVPAAIFGLSHWGAGFAAMLGAFGVGIVFSLIYARTRRLWPLIIAHYGMSIVLLGPDSYRDIRLPF